jgi:hypothetical protein
MKNKNILIVSFAGNKTLFTFAAAFRAKFIKEIESDSG